MTEIFELPLFPLNTVLFPGMYLPLHVFEDRYKQMIGACLADDQPFGVVCIQEGVVEMGPLPVPHAIGCTAEIVQMRSLSEGRMFVVTVGQERFRILSVNDERPYLVGEVELLPFAEEQGTIVTRAADNLYPLVIDYLEILSRLGDVEIDKSQVPTDPQGLAALAASVIQIPLDQKQAFLATDQAGQLLHDLRSTYREEVSLLRLLPEMEQGMFSLN